MHQIYRLRADPTIHQTLANLEFSGANLVPILVDLLRPVQEFGGSLPRPRAGVALILCHKNAIPKRGLESRHPRESNLSLSGYSTAEP